jgi:hypothetical protein
MAISQEQYQNIEAVLTATPPDATGDLCKPSENGYCHCALGKLALAAGISEKRLLDGAGYSDMRASKEFETRFGLGDRSINNRLVDFSVVYFANDKRAKVTPQERAQDVLKALQYYVVPPFPKEAANV